MQVARDLCVVRMITGFHDDEIHEIWLLCDSHGSQHVTMFRAFRASEMRLITLAYKCPSCTAGEMHAFLHALHDDHTMQNAGNVRRTNC